ncbi:MAG: hypothetical protein GX488_05480 [Clostridiales bacterium]|nr:hypothetical protein [Clostridiales bacterium]
MAIKARDIYDGRKKSRFRLGIVILVIFALLVAAILVFYWLRSYAVYDENGNATLILPFSEKEEKTEASPSAVPSESPSGNPPQSTSGSDTNTAEPPETAPTDNVPEERNAG